MFWLIYSTLGYTQEPTSETTEETESTEESTKGTGESTETPVLESTETKAPETTEIPATEIPATETTESETSTTDSQEEAKDEMVLIEEPIIITTPGTLRLQATYHPGFVVDFEGRELEDGWTFDSRLRTGLDIVQKDWKFILNGDIANGQFAGQPWNLEGTEHRYHPERIGILHPDNFLLRNAYLHTQIGKIGILTGVMTSHWGLGIVSNDGAHEQEFGRADYGDRMLRTALYTKVANAIITVAGDVVLEDDIGGDSDGFRSYQALTSLRLPFSQTDQIGFLGLYRDQTEISSKHTLKGFFLDAYGMFSKSMGDITVSAQAEAAYLHGTTNRLSNRNHPEGLDVRSFGSAFRLGAEHAKIGKLGINGGFASGDSDPSDGTYSTFTFDRDHNAGSLLFDVHQAAREIAEYNLLTDPQHAGQPPDGVEALVTEGAIRQSMYIQPYLQYNVIPSFNLRLGSVLAWSTTPIQSPFVSYRNGGVALNHLGESTDGYLLGTELNWRATFLQPFSDKQSVSLYVEGAHLLPSANLGMESTLSMVRIQSLLSW